jgi:predicted transcriptional regulator
MHVPYLLWKQRFVLKALISLKRKKKKTKKEKEALPSVINITKGYSRYHQPDLN